jgi:hypothetical protein
MHGTLFLVYEFKVDLKDCPFCTQDRCYALPDNTVDNLSLLVRAANS